MEREQQELLQKIAAAGTASGEYHRKAGAQTGAEDCRRLFTGGLCVCDEHFMAKSAGMIIIALFALLFHYGFAHEYYNLQFSRFTGGYTSTGAQVHQITHIRGTDLIDLKTDDGRMFTVKTDYIKAARGDKVEVAYNSFNPRYAYLKNPKTLLDVFLYNSLIALGAFIYCVIKAVSSLKYGRIFRRLKAANKYVTVEPTGVYDTRIKRIGGGSAKSADIEQYRLLYRLEIPQAGEYFFAGSWSVRAPEKQLARDNIEYRVYFEDPDNPSGSMYFIDEVKRR